MFIYLCLYDFGKALSACADPSPIPLSLLSLLLTSDILDSGCPWADRLSSLYWTGDHSTLWSQSHSCSHSL